MATTTLLGGIVRRFDAAGTLTASMSQGLYVGLEPEGKSLPFVVLLHMGETPEWCFENAYLEHGEVQFHVFAAGLANTEEIATNIKATFDPPAGGRTIDLQIAGATTISFLRTGYVVTADEQKSSEGQIVYHCQIDYSSELKRTLSS